MVVSIRPGMRAFAAAPGERVEVTSSDGVATFVTAPASLIRLSGGAVGRLAGDARGVSAHGFTREIWIK